MKHGGEGLVVDSRSLQRQPGASLRVRARADMSDLGNDVARADPGEVGVDILLESVLDGILVTGSAHVPATGECVRCLDPVPLEVDAQFQLLFTYPGAESQEDLAEDADIVPMATEDLDVTQAFRDAVVLALPLTPTCRPDCPGLCPQCGARLADDPGHRHEQPDPRWSELARWRGTGPAPEGE